MSMSSKFSKFNSASANERIMQNKNPEVLHPCGVPDLYGILLTLPMFLRSMSIFKFSTIFLYKCRNL